SFTGTSITNNGTIGRFYDNDFNFITLGGPIIFASQSINQQLNGNGAVNSLTINNSNGVTVGGNQTINGNISLTAGKFITGANKIILGPAATLTGGGTTSYI